MTTSAIDLAVQSEAAQVSGVALPQLHWQRTAAFATAVQRHLLRLAEECGPQVARHPIPYGAVGYVRKLLEQRRAYGSEAMFGCGTIDFRRNPAVMLAWLGDIDLVMLGTGGQRRDFSGNTADRWSSRLGPRGEVECRRWRLDDVDRVVLCSDGVAADLDAVIDLGDHALDAVLAAATQRPDGDDMALLDIALRRRALPDPSVTRRAGQESVQSGRSLRFDPGAPVSMDAPGGVDPLPSRDGSMRC
jgi:hypothetical protein